MSDFLAEMAAESARRVGLALGDGSIRQRASEARPPIPLRLTSSGFDIIAESKLASPSEGALTEGGGDRALALASAYAHGGAAALSVLTEETRFGGSLDHLTRVARHVDAPVMRKDFMVDPIQVLEARAAGASGVLLIARMLPGNLLVEMTDLTLELGMFALVEIFDRSDLETASQVFDRDVLVGVNSRDLATLEVEASRFEELAPHLPTHLPAVAESGLATPEDVAGVARLGYRMALVGSSLVTSEDPSPRLGELLAAGRLAVAGVER